MVISQGLTMSKKSKGVTISKNALKERLNLKSELINKLRNTENIEEHEKYSKLYNKLLDIEKEYKSILKSSLKRNK